MNIIGNVIHNLGVDGLILYSVPRCEWISPQEVAGMRDEMRSRIDANVAYRSRSAHAVKYIYIC